MKIIKYRAYVNETKCTGDKLCENICPSGAIRVLEKKAKVDSEKCLACTRCVDRCTKDAVTMVPREQPRVVGVSAKDVDPAELKELLHKAHRLPTDLVCVCTITFAEEIAAAIIKGARSVREVALMTGVMTGCQEFCVPTIQRMLKVYGVNIEEAGAPTEYDQTFSMWDIPREQEDKFAGYYFKEDRDLASQLRNE